MKIATLYILEGGDGSFYTALTTNLGQRMTQHEAGCVTGYTASKGLCRLAYAMEFPTIREAAAAERWIKGWTHAKKRALVDGDIEYLKSLSECRNESHAKNEGDRR